MSLCANCGQPLAPAVAGEIAKHHNGIVFCAFVTPQIDWHDQHTARRDDQ